jgi:hypothetical protein
MIKSIWHGSLIAAVIFYSGNIFFSTSSCDRVERTGSIIRVPAAALFFLADNWLGLNDQKSFREDAHRFDLWFQNVVRVTFYGRQFTCGSPALQEKSGLVPLVLPDTTPVPSSTVKAQDATTIGGVLLSSPDDLKSEKPIVNKNPFNLPSLPSDIK